MLINRVLRPACKYLSVIVPSIYFVCALSWAMPDGFPFKSRINGFARQTFLVFGLWQNWDMFGPSPRGDDIYVSVKSHFSDGKIIENPVSKMNDLPLFKRWQRERWRKYFNDHIRLDSESGKWESCARWFLNQRNAEGELPVRVELWRYWRPTNIPVDPSLRPDRNQSSWNAHKFHTVEARKG